ncbi:SIMPL domain-containing protein [Mycetocola sp. 2940]|uniref:SIMPL domain-containing protein n=1 Tax=Mycetocola sp. 2940 TaxID=3156452 RepID=UPI003392BE13
MNDTAGQGSEQQAVVISVRGDAFAEAPAERATVSLTVGFDGAERHDVRERSTAALGECIGSIASLHEPEAGPVVTWTADDVQVWADRPWNTEGAQLPLVYHSRANVTVTFSDFPRLSLWLEDTANRDGISVGGVSWTVSDLTRRELEARAQRDAVAHALDKATVYAASLGLGTVTPRELSEPATLAHPLVVREDARMFSVAGPSVDLAPAPVRVDVDVHLRFTAEA